ncbi:Alpha-glucosidase yihQ [Quillaja saponaria]|uniref:Alpha-glucosidase yihQ n=1 Tax=Quillaja saponaria TaxID=32244 RepID=A0AAD7Q871_QUISA|nr:Alpha-glucosidase yihQ [Quillaja saponaria]
MAETEVEESRGSFLVKDKDIHLVCSHQIIDQIRVINPFDHHLDGKEEDSPSGILVPKEKTDVKATHFPSLLITGRLFNMTKKNKKFQKYGIHGSIQFEAKEPSTYARYWILFDQKTNNQVGFQVKLEQPNCKSGKQDSPPASGRYRGFRRRLGIRKRRLGWFWYFSRPRGFVTASSTEEETEEMKVPESAEFNRVCLTYASEASERFYGFGEQFSHMDFKGKRVPILVQEQGIGRGDQPITFAANLVSYRAGGDWSTTYAPSPFYMTSKMRSLYLEGYDYSVFDLTKQDRVQVQIHGNSVEGRILHGQLTF